jgi:predicted AAA+ superfamily ATPase
MAMKPWYKVVTPREDLREGKPLDASEFAVHLDQVRHGRAPSVYQRPEEFFDRTYLTKSLRELAVQVLRRMNGEKVETSAVFNLSTQFGGGKTHALTFLYHLAKGGEKARSWKGVSGLLQEAGVSGIPETCPARVSGG